MWEFALEACKELGKEYEEQTYDYGQLSSLLNRMAQLYDKILKQRRHEPEYFRVAYYGRGFPAFLQNKVIFHLINIKNHYYPTYFFLLLK